LFAMWAALLWALSRSGSRPKARILFPLFLTFIAAIDAVRHIPLFVLLATPVIAGSLSEASVWPGTSALKTSGGIRSAFRGAVLLLLTVFAVVRWIELARSQAQAESEHFPAAAVEFLHSQPFPGRLFAYYDWGGYAVWKLFPQYHVFVDGRADLYGDDLLRKFQQVAELKNGWRQVLERAQVGTVLLPPSGALAQGLLLDPQWQERYRDSRAVIFERRPAPE
jgi:hypothetical protein